MFSKHSSLPAWLCVLVLTGAAAHASGLTRQEAIQQALEVNPEVTAAQKAWEASRARVTQARALPDPEFEVEYEELSKASSLGGFGQRDVGVTQSIDFPLTWWRRGRAASQAAQATRLAVLESVRLDVRTRVKVAYDRVLFSNKRLGYLEENLQLAQNFLDKAQLRVEAGDVSVLEVLRAEVEAGRAANRVTEARSDLAVARTELKTLLAHQDRTPLELAGNLDYRPTELDLESLLQLSLARRPDLEGAGWALASARSQQAAARSAFLPGLNLGLFRQTVEGPEGRDNFWRVGAALEFPLWGAAQQRGELAEAAALVGQAAAEQSAFRYRVLLEVESAFLDVKTSAAQVQLSRDRILREAERSFEVASLSYTEGKATYLELLEAQRTLTEVREEYAEALFDYRAALAGLEQATGSELSE